MKWLSVFKHIKCIHCCRRHCCLAWAYPRSPTIQSKWFNLLFILLKILHRVSRILIISNQNREIKNVHTMPAQIGFGNFSSKPQQRSLHYCNITLHLQLHPSIKYMVILSNITLYQWLWIVRLHKVMQTFGVALFCWNAEPRKDNGFWLN